MPNSTSTTTIGMFDICHLQNSTLAGGVAMGVAAHLPMSPAAAIATGFVASMVSVAGYKYLTPLLGQRLRLQVPPTPQQHLT